MVLRLCVGCMFLVTKLVFSMSFYLGTVLIDSVYFFSLFWSVFTKNTHARTFKALCPGLPR